LDTLTAMMLQANLIHQIDGNTDELDALVAAHYHLSTAVAIDTTTGEVSDIVVELIDEVADVSDDAHLVNDGYGEEVVVQNDDILLDDYTIETLPAPGFTDDDECITLVIPRAALVPFLHD